MSALPTLSRWPGILFRVACFAGLWLILVEGELKSAWFGAPFVVGAVWCTSRHRGHRTRPWSLVGMAVIGLYFLGESVLSGLDVATRALRPRMGLDPVFARYRLRLGPGPARSLFVHALTLMPGTLSAHLEGDDLTLHLLDRKMHWREGLERLELLTAYACGVHCGDPREAVP